MTGLSADSCSMDGASLAEIADQQGTPCFVYSAAHCRQQYQHLGSALAGVDHTICYAVKANPSLGVLQLFAELGAGFDIVSGGELLRVIEAGGDVSKVLFSGVGKRADEIDFALKTGIACFNVESETELERIEARAAALAIPAPVSVRVNPDVDANTHPYISTGLKENKFGVPTHQAMAMYQRAATSDHLDVVGIDCHIGSQITDQAPFGEALSRLLDMVDELEALGIKLTHIDLGGGLGISYDDAPPLDPETYGQTIRSQLGNRDLHFLLEPGRFLVANAGVLLTRVEYLKPQATPEHRNFAVVDAAMNDLIRPALYQAWHEVSLATPASSEATLASWDIVGPVCESGDFIAHERTLALAPGSLVAVHSAGAYGFAQASNYNSRPRAAEILVDQGTARLIRARETQADMLGPERRALGLGANTNLAS